MPNTKSMKQHVIKSEENRLQNRARKTRIASTEKEFRQSVEAGNKAEAEAAYNVVCKSLDKAVKANVIHANKAARKKSRLSNALNTLA
ncbi:MAG: 30S ribosomal protein S20 [Lentisphaeria bacterium]|nr:30S ribosomal protein S20 [Lentisphaeria bacterium]NQZ70357.1 30S ribosomal protein S20 [Lentisphaeria bacterium]